MAVAFTTEHTRTSEYLFDPKKIISFWYYVAKDLLAGVFGLLLLASLAYVILA